MKLQFGSALLAIALCASAVEAQKPGVMGIGITIGPADVPSSSEEVPLSSALLVPLNFGAFRLEPSLGITRMSLSSPDPFGGSDDLEETQSVISFGVGAYYMTSLGDGFTLYGGPRFGILRSSSSEEGGGSPKQSVTSTDKFIGAAVGGEHFFSRHFSIGAEGRLTYYIAGEPEFDPDPGFETDFSASLTTTSGLFVARFYF